LKLPDVVTFHTMGKEKNRAFGNQLEPELRIKSEQAIVAGADCIVTSTDEGKII